MYLLDTNIISNLIKKNPSLKLTNKLKTIPSNDLHISVITVMELYLGMELCSDPKIILEFIEDWVFKTIKILSFDNNYAKLAASIQAKLRKNGKSLDWLDIMISSCAISENLIFVTDNTKHFSRIEDLKIENWL